jgi:uncharacterized protein (DUF2252 family)
LAIIASMPPPSRKHPPRPEARQSHLLGLRNAKMASSAHAYVRGSTLRFYEWLQSLAPRSLPEGPPVWICGDAHVSNIGPVANADGKIDILLRDFDQTVVGNPAHDLIRLALSLAMASRGSDLPGVTTARMLEQMVGAYADVVVPPEDEGEPLTRPAAVGNALRDARRRSWRHLAKERVRGETVRLPLGKRFWPLSADERGQVEALLHTDAVRDLATSLHHRDDDAHVEVIDAAFWVKGCSSLGRLRIAVLLDVAGEASLGRDLCLIDIKEAGKPLAPRVDDARMPRDNAERVVGGATALSPFLGERMLAARLLERPVVLRELLPQDLKLEIDSLSAEEAGHVARYLAQVVGKAHARQLDAAQRKQWAGELRRNRSKSLEMPSWLWSSVVELVGQHERAYLDHCRRYAMAQPA